jgi:hypothetical protein
VRDEHLLEGVRVVRDLLLTHDAGGALECVREAQQPGDQSRPRLLLQVKNPGADLVDQLPRLDPEVPQWIGAHPASIPIPGMAVRAAGRWAAQCWALEC